MNVIRIITITLLALAYTTLSHATVITIGFEGNAIGPGLPGGYCGPITCEEKYGAILYAPFSGLITFDSIAPDQNANDPASGFYVSSGNPYGIQFVIGDFTGQSNEVNISVAPETFTSIPQYHFFADSLGATFSRIGLINCYEGLPGTITSDAQLTTPPPVGVNCFDPAYITTYDGFDIALNVSSYFLVPEPTTIALFAIGLIGIGASVRSRALARQS